MELPANFIPFLPLINYYRDTLKLDCLVTRLEQFRFYTSYIGKGKHAKRPKDFWQDDELGYQYLFYGCKKCLHGKSWNKIIDLNNEQDMMNEIAKGSAEEIEKYSRDLYPHKDLKEIETDKDNRIITISNCYDDQTISLSYISFKLYCNFYHDCIKQFKPLSSNIIKIPIYFGENTGCCIEDLINNMYIKAYINVIDLKEYMDVTDYLGVSFT